MAEKGKTVGEWLVEQAKGEAGEAREIKLRMLDALGVLALLLFNLQCWWAPAGSYCGF